MAEQSFDFLNEIVRFSPCKETIEYRLEYLSRIQSSETLHTKVNPTFCLLGSLFV
jgi:hypothetical protein